MRPIEQIKRDYIKARKATIAAERKEERFYQELKEAQSEAIRTLEEIEYM